MMYGNDSGYEASARDIENLSGTSDLVGDPTENADEAPQLSIS